MKFLHLADLHLGKKLHGYDLLEDQKYVLEQVLQYGREHQVDMVLIAGDVYDSSQPSLEAVNLLDWFLTSLSQAGMEVLMIAGNHDSADRLAFGRNLLKNARVFIQGRWQGEDDPLVRKDAFGQYTFHLVPFLKPREVRHYFQGVESYDDAFRQVVQSMDRSTPGRHILIAHQFFGGSISDSEMVVGTLEQVDARHLEGFDYCALGHLHNPQSIKAPQNRYAGTLLKYSTSEIRHLKTFTCVTMEKEITIEEIPVKPLRDVRAIQGLFRQLTDPAFYREQNREDYLDIFVEDEQEIPGAYEDLKKIYPRLLKLNWPHLPALGVEENSTGTLDLEDDVLISRFYEIRTGLSMTPFQEDLIRSLWQEVMDETC